MPYYWLEPDGAGPRPSCAAMLPDAVREARALAAASGTRVRVFFGRPRLLRAAAAPEVVVEPGGGDA